MTKTEQELTNLILYGKINSGKENEEDAAIELLKKAAEHNPDILWASIFEAFSYEFIGMSVPAMAAYMCSQNARNHFNYKIKSYFIDILLTFNPVVLLDLTEHVKSKVFGSGLGSRNQKILRSVMERWSVDTLKEYSQLYPVELCSLVKLLHPRFHGDKAKIIENIANKKI